MPRFAASTLQKSDKAARGRTTTEDTPVAIRSKVELGPRVERAIRASLGRKLGHAATLIERGTVRFEDVNGPKGGLDTVCRIKLVMSGRPSVIAEERAADPQTAFDLAMPKVARALEKDRDKHDRSVRKRHRGKGVTAATAGRKKNGATGGAYTDPGEVMGSVIGRRVGHGPSALNRALARPSKRRGDAFVDTADPGVSVTDRKAGAGSTARRNTLKKVENSSGVAALEDSRTKPSRKSTRKSADRVKQGTSKERAERGKLNAPTQRTARGTARRSVAKRK